MLQQKTPYSSSGHGNMAGTTSRSMASMASMVQETKQGTGRQTLPVLSVVRLPTESAASRSLGAWDSLGNRANSLWISPLLGCEHDEAAAPCKLV